MIQSIIENKLAQEFTPSYLAVMNESHMHNVPPGSESHFKVVVVSDVFNGLRLIARHRAINQLLAVELAESIHALSIHAYTSDEWHQQQERFPESPKCHGGEQ
jgi:BolA family transcriptional regulator, general stress-responsive regulator